MAALGQTISGVAHELNNPLATILTWAERLSKRTPLDDQVRRGLETILSESERAARIVRNLLTFARKRQTTRAMVDVNQVVRETLALRAHDQRLTNITIIDALAAGLPPVFADGYQLQQVLLNLVINAEQAMLAANGRGTLVLRTWHDNENDARDPGNQRRRARDPRRGAAQDLRSVLHDEGCRQGHGARSDRGVRDRAGARRAHSSRIQAGYGCVVFRRAADQRREARRGAGTTCAGAAVAGDKSAGRGSILVVEDETRARQRRRRGAGGCRVHRRARRRWRRRARTRSRRGGTI